MGGKLHAFISTLPKVGARALVMRDMGSRANVKEPLKVMESASKEYRVLAELAAENLVRILVAPYKLTQEAYNHSQHVRCSQGEHHELMPFVEICMLGGHYLLFNAHTAEGLCVGSMMCYISQHDPICRISQ